MPILGVFARESGTKNSTGLSEKKIARTFQSYPITVLVAPQMIDNKCLN